MKTDTDVVYVADQDGNLIFIRTFDIDGGGEPERQKAIATYNEVNKQFGYGILCGIERLKIKVRI